MNKLLCFITGVVVGSAVTYNLVKTKFERIAQEEIDSVKETFSTRKAYQDTINEQGYAPTESTKPASEKQKREKRQPIDYTAYSKKKDISEEDNLVLEKEEPSKASPTEKPYVIAPEDFGEFDDYERCTLWLFADKVLTDDDEEPVEDVEDLVGSSSLEHFGEYEDDAVYVRNDKYKCDFEILIDQRRYYDEVVPTKPRS